jgi:hypothetical protein
MKGLNRYMGKIKHSGWYYCMLWCPGVLPEELVGGVKEKIGSRLLR